MLATHAPINLNYDGGTGGSDPISRGKRKERETERVRVCENTRDRIQQDSRQ